MPKVGTLLHRTQDKKFVLHDLYKNLKEAVCFVKERKNDMTKETDLEINVLVIKVIKLNRTKKPLPNEQPEHKD